MGAVRLIYDETLRQSKALGSLNDLDLQGTRKAMAGPLRYCLAGNTLHLPQDQWDRRYRWNADE